MPHDLVSPEHAQLGCDVAHEGLQVAGILCGRGVDVLLGRRDIVSRLLERAVHARIDEPVANLRVDVGAEQGDGAEPNDEGRDDDPEKE